MVTAVDIQVVFDESGAVKGIKNLETQSAISFNNIRNQSKTLGDSQSKDFERSRQAGELLNHDLGIALPRTMTKLIAQSATLGPLLAGAFEVSIFLTAAEAIGRIGTALYNAAERAMGLTAELKAVQDEATKASRAAEISFTGISDTSRLPKMVSETAALQKQVPQLETNRWKALLFGGYATGDYRDSNVTQFFNAQRAYNVANDKLQSNQKDLPTAQANAAKTNYDFIQKELQAQNELNQIGLSGVNLIKEKTDGEQAMLKVQMQQKGVNLGSVEAQQQSYDITLRGQKEIAQAYKQYAIERMQGEQQISEMGLQGLGKIMAAQKDADQLNNQRLALGMIDETKYANDKALLHQKAAKEIALYYIDANEKIATEEAAINAIGLKGVAALKAQASDALRTLDAAAAKGEFSGPGGQDIYNRQKQDVATKQAKETAELLKQYSREADAAMTSAYASSLGGVEQLSAEEQNEIAKLRVDWNDLYGALKAGSNERLQAETALNEQIYAVESETAKKIRDLRQQTNEQTVEMESSAAIAALPDYQRADAQIIASAQQRERELTLLLQKGEINREDYIRRDAAIQEEMNAQLVDDMSSKMQSFFDDITSGNIGKTLLQNWEKMIFRLVAQWILGVNQMQQASANAAGASGGGGGGIGGLLGGLLGLGTGMPGGVPMPGMSGSPMLGSSFFGGASLGSSSFMPGDIGAAGGGLSGIGIGAGGGGLSGIGGLGIGNSFLPTGAMGGNDVLSTILGGGTGGAISAGQGGGSVAAQQKAGAGGLSGLLALAKNNPLLLALTGGIIGSKVGGPLGAIGAGMLGLATAAGLGSTQATALAASLGLAPALFIGIGGGLLGAGVGYQTGSKTIGGITGAVAGGGLAALLAPALGLGPVGIAVAAIIGLIGGIFGGLFGGKAKKNAADKLANQQFLPEISKVLDDYKSYQADYSTAMSELDTISTDAYNAMSKYGSQGKGEFNKLIPPAIDAAKKSIDSYQHERDRRSSLYIAPPQFHGGGFVGGYYGQFQISGNEVMSKLQMGEFVTNPQATKKYRPVLEAMNSGQPIATSSPEIHVHVHALDASDFVGFLNRGGARKIRAAIAQDQLLYGGTRG